MGKDKEELRFINKDKKISDEKLVFLKAISDVIKTGMNIVGVNTPEQM
jgi:arginyl-tRNA synthetase